MRKKKKQKKKKRKNKHKEGKEDVKKLIETAATATAKQQLE